MTRYCQQRQLSALIGYKSDGTQILPALDPNNATLGPCQTLGVATYLFPFGGDYLGSVAEAVMASLSGLWTAALSATVTIEATNYPKTITGNNTGAADITDWDTTTGAWQKIDPTLAGAVYAVATGTGVMTKYTCAITAAGGGGAGFWNVPDLGALRLRAKVVVTVGGVVRFMGHAKLGS